MRRLWAVGRWAALVVLLAAALVLGRLWYALPVVSGTLKLPGATAPIEVLRDEYGIPHIRAASEADAIFGLGVVHAQDRLWQLEFQRRLGAGRLAEILGEAALPTDRLFRTLGLHRAAVRAIATLSPEARRLLEAYVAGVNAVIASRSSQQLPIEFAIFGVRPEPYTPADVLAWAKVMALTLSTNYRDEMLRAKIAARVGADGAQALLPAYSDEWPLILPHGLTPAAAPPVAAPVTDAPAGGAAVSPADWLARLARLASTVPDSPYVTSALGASNNWVVSGARSATGKPLLANDPHLGARLPSTWYLAHLEGGRINAIGATLPGAPGIVIGHNARIAWGVTNLMADVQDLYVERLNAKGEAGYDGRWEPLQIVTEIIRVKGAADVPIAVRITRHGPIVSDTFEHPASEALALRWTALDPDDTTIEAFFGVMAAGTWDDFTHALSAYRAPIQNWVYADVDGNIGYLAPGRLPIRAAGDGTLPVPGWVSTYEWTGFVPERDWPRAFNPPEGLLVTANNQALPAGAFPLISTNWEPGYRAQRILERLRTADRLSADDFARLHADVQSAQVPALLPWMLDRTSPPDEAGRAALERLRQWDGQVTRDSAGAAIFMHWYRRFTRALWEDDLGDALWHEYDALPHWVGKAMHRLVRREDTAWCDDGRTAGRETCESLLSRSLQAAIADMRETYRTDDQSRWRWGRANVVTFAHLPLEAVPGLRRVFSRRAEHAGHAFTVTPTMRVQDQTVISSYREILDVSDWDRSRFIHPLGQSGQLLSGHYDDLHDLWRAVGYVPMRYSRGAVDAAVRSRLRIEP